jgi:hypothetical protein
MSSSFAFLLGAGGRENLPKLQQRRPMCFGTKRGGWAGGALSRARQERPTCFGTDRCSNKKARSAADELARSHAPAWPELCGARVHVFRWGAVRFQRTVAIPASLLEKPHPPAHLGPRAPWQQPRPPGGQVSPTRPPCSLAVIPGGGWAGMPLGGHYGRQHVLATIETGRTAPGTRDQFGKVVAYGLLRSWGCGLPL